MKDKIIFSVASLIIIASSIFYSIVLLKNYSLLDEEKYAVISKVSREDSINSEEEKGKKLEETIKEKEKEKKKELKEYDLWEKMKKELESHLN